MCFLDVFILFLWGDCMFVSKTYSITDIYWYSADGSKLSGIYTTGTNSGYTYITRPSTSLLFPAVPTGDFEFTMKVYRPAVLDYRSLLLEFGVSKSNTLLVGWDNGGNNDAKNIRIYNRQGSQNTSVAQDTNPQYNNGEWMDFTLRFENGTVSLTVGNSTITTSFSTISRIGNYYETRSFMSEFKIRTL